MFRWACFCWHIRLHHGHQVLVNWLPQLFHWFWLKKGLISNSLHFALNLWMALPPPASQTFFTYILLLRSSVPLQTPECSEYHPFAQSPVIRALSLTKPKQPGTNSSPLSVRHPLSVPSTLPWKPFSFRKHFFQSPFPEVPVCVKVCVCVWLFGWAWVCSGVCVCCLYELLTSKYMYVLHL